MDRAVARMGEMRNACKILVGNYEENRPRERPGCRWEDNTRMDLKEISWKDVDWFHHVECCD
jgi:hypothetical protein